MKKKIIKESKYLGTCYSLFDGKSLNEIIILIQDIRKTYGEDSTLDYFTEYNYDDGVGAFNVFYNREETDEELATRMKRNRSAKIAKKKSDAKRKEKKEKRDLLEYERLKAKYEKNT